MHTLLRLIYCKTLKCAIYALEYLQFVRGKGLEAWGRMRGWRRGCHSALWV